MKVLDLGCGERIKPDATHIIDLIRPNPMPETLKYIKHDLNESPYPLESHTFDKIYADNVYEHLGLNLFAFLKECYRLLKQDGILIFKTPNPWFILHRLRFLVGISLPSYMPQHIQYPKPSFVKEIMTHMGFEARGHSSNLFSHVISFEARKR